MTARQFGTLRYIQTHDVSIEHVKMLNLNTFGSLWDHEWLTKRGDGILVLTRRGSQALESYTKALPSYRKQAGELSDRVKMMLRLRLHETTKAS